MAHSVMRQTACSLILALGTSAHVQSEGLLVQKGSGDARDEQQASPVQSAEESTWSQSDEELRSAKSRWLDRIWATLSQQADSDGPINTDRPTFTPANTVVPRGRLQFESGFTFNQVVTSRARSAVYDAPELAMRYGLFNRVEFRTFWLGETDTQSEADPRRRGGPSGGLSDMEVGFKWQLFAGDEQRKWIPTTALITSITAPTGGSSPLSSHMVEPYINLIYGWSPSKKLTLAGSTGYLGQRQQPSPDSSGRADSFERYHQSLVAFFSATERTTLFYEWYVLMFTNAADNRPVHFMDGGVLYRLTPNIQIDIRAGFGLSGRPDDFFTGTGFSVRF